MLLRLIAGNSFFQSIVFLCFFICSHPLDTVFSRRVLAALNCLYAFDRYFYLRRICYFKGALAAIHSRCYHHYFRRPFAVYSIFKGTVFLWNKHLQSYPFSLGRYVILSGSNVCFCRDSFRVAKLVEKTEFQR